MLSRDGALAGPSHLAIAVAQRTPDVRFVALVNGAVRLHMTRRRFDFGAALATVVQHADPADAEALLGDNQLEPTLANALRRRGFRERQPGVWIRYR